MEKLLSSIKARDQFKTIIDEVHFHGEKYVIERHGKPIVAIVPIQIYQNWKRKRYRLLELIQEVQKANVGVDSTEALMDVLEAQQATRK